MECELPSIQNLWCLRYCNQPAISRGTPVWLFVCRFGCRLVGMKSSPKIFENQVIGSDEPDGHLPDELIDAVEVENEPSVSEQVVLDGPPSHLVDAKPKLYLGDSELVGRAHATKRKRDELNLTEAVKARLLVGNTIDMLADAIVREMLTGNTGVLKEMMNRIDGPVSEQTVSYQVKVEMTPDQQVAKIKELEAKARRRMLADRRNRSIESEESEDE